MFMQLFFSKVHPACHSIVNGSNQEVTLKRLISMLRIAQKLYVGALSDQCEMYMHSCLYRKIFMQVRAFERYFSLKCFRHNFEKWFRSLYISTLKFVSTTSDILFA